MLKYNDITLRAPEPNDVDFLYEVENDLKLWHVSQTLVPFSRFDLEQYILSTDKQRPFAAGQVRFVIEWTKPDKKEKIGFVDLFAIDALNRRAGVGILLLEAYRGKGLAGKALDLLIEYAFNFLNLHQLYCNIEQGNETSLQLFKSRNFQVTGVKKEWNLAGDQWKDVFLLQLLPKK